MPGTFTFKPVEANLTDEKGFQSWNDPYCKVRIGFHSEKTSVAQHEGKNPHWFETLLLKEKKGGHHATVKVKEHMELNILNLIGKTQVDLDEVRAHGRVVKKYPLQRRGNSTGEILLEIEYHPQAVNLV